MLDKHISFKDIIIYVYYFASSTVAGFTCTGNNKYSAIVIIVSFDLIFLCYRPIISVTCLRRSVISVFFVDICLLRFFIVASFSFI